MIISYFLLKKIMFRLLVKLFVKKLYAQNDILKCQISFYHLRNTTLNDTNTKKESPVHIIIGAGDYRPATCRRATCRPATCRVDKNRLGGNFSRPGKYCNKYAVFNNISVKYKY